VILPIGAHYSNVFLHCSVPGALGRLTAVN
jgi:hypothetical protein